MSHPSVRHQYNGNKRMSNGTQEGSGARPLSEEDIALLEKEERMTPAERAKRDERRAQVIGEIQSTERSYVLALDALYEGFVAPLKERMAHRAFSDISPASVEALCSNLETLHNFHHKFIAELNRVGTVTPAAAPPPASPHAAVVSPSPSASPSSAVPASSTSAASPAASIPSVFLRYSEFFRLYIPYLNGYERALHTFNELRKHKKFAEWLGGDVKNALREHATKHGTSQLDLLSYMIQPVQRVPRYVLLISELKRQTSPAHPEYCSLTDALTAVARVASVINEGQRAVENMSKTAEVQQRIVGDFETLIQPHRRLIKEGVVTATYTHGLFATLRTRRSVFFLFSDLLLWTSEEFKFKGSMDLTPAKLSPRTSTSFSIDTAVRVVQVGLESEEAAKEWFEAIENVVCQLQNEREKLRQRARVHKSRAHGTGEKDAVHARITEHLQELAIKGKEAGAASGANGSTEPGSDAHGHSAAASSSPAPAAAPGTFGRGTLGQRSGRKWDEALDASEAKLRREQNHLAAFSREKMSADTFAPPEPELGEFASSSASPPAVAVPAASASSPAVAAAAPVVVGGGDRKYQARFVNRRGKSTLGKRDCLCTLILVHAECPKHGQPALDAERERQLLMGNSETVHDEQ